jgi:hypothetical protein
MRSGRGKGGRPDDALQSATLVRSEFMSNGRRLSTEEKKEIFSHLVATQDAVANVRKSYEMVTEQYSISEEQLKQIEDEGVENEWPPLSEPVSAH